MPDPARAPATDAPADLGQTPPAPRVAAMVTTTKQGIAVKRDARGRLLPGQSMNPGGRPEGLGKRVRDMVDFDKAIETLVDIAWGKLAPASRVADRIKAIELLFDRGFGKAQQTVDIKDSNAAHTASRIKQLPTAKLIATVEAMRALAAGAATAADTDEE